MSTSQPVTQGTIFLFKLINAFFSHINTYTIGQPTRARAADVSYMSSRRPSFSLAELAAGQTSLKKVKKKKKRDRSAPALAKSAEDAAERAAEEATRLKYFFDTGLDRVIEALGEELTFPTESLPILREEAAFIVRFWWTNCHNDAAREAREATGVQVELPDELGALAERIDASMQERGWGSGSGAFVKLSTRSPKDSTLAFDTAAALYKERLRAQVAATAGKDVTLNQRLRLLCESMGASLKVESGAEAVLHMLHSERVWEDLTYALSSKVADEVVLGDAEASLLLETALGESAFTAAKDECAFAARVCIVVRGWCDLPLWSEFRGFVWGGNLTAVAQYFHPVHFPELAAPATQLAITHDLSTFFETKLRGKIPLDHYIVDFVWKPDGTALLVEVNPFDGVLGSFAASTGLFSWDDDRAILTGEAAEKTAAQAAARLRAIAASSVTPPDFVVEKLMHQPPLILRIREEVKAEAYVKNELRPEWRDVLYQQGKHRKL